MFETAYIDGKAQLISRAEAKLRLRNRCMIYVNEQIVRAINSNKITIEIKKEHLIEEVIEEIKKQYYTIETPCTLIMYPFKENYKNL